MIKYKYSKGRYQISEGDKVIATTKDENWALQITTALNMRLPKGACENCITHHYACDCREEKFCKFLETSYQIHQLAKELFEDEEV